jgi:hypothetical protein
MFKTLPFSELLPSADTLYTNAAESDEIKARLAAEPYEYTDQDYADGLALVQQVRDLDVQQQSERGDSTRSTEVAQAAYEALRSRFTKHRELARKRVSRDAAGFSALSLAGNTPRRRDELLREVRRFYGAIVERPELVEKIRGLSPTVATDALAQADAAQAASSAQIQEQSEATGATANRDEVVADLREHADELAAIAELALEDRPDLLRSLGLRA